MKPIDNIIYLAVCSVVALAAWSCSSTDDDPQPSPTPMPPTTPSAEYERTVLVYIAADNNLNTWALRDIDEMREGMKSITDAKKVNLIVYHVGTDRKPRLMQVNTDGTSTELKSYDSAQSSLSAGRMSEVIADVKEIYPSDNYGLVLWSHGSGWASESGSIEEQSLSAASMQESPHSFGQEGSGNNIKRMKITSLAAALEGTKFEYIYFDCCHMATVEVVYELRHATDLIVASVTELGIEGMPYELNVAHLLKGSESIPQAMANTFKFYDNRYDDFTSDDPWGCSISLINTKAIGRLAEATRSIYQSGATLDGTYTGVRCYRPGVIDGGIFDMSDYIHALNAPVQLTAAWEQAFNDVVVSHKATEKVYTLSTEKFKGLGCHIVRTAADSREYGFDETAWWRDVASHITLQ